MANPKGPNKVEIRSFQVGFGDCFLVSFDYGVKKQKHVLIDFGTTGLPAKFKKTKATYMPMVAADIETLVRNTGELVAVVATHRHADHISGFGTDTTTGKSGDIIRNLKPRLVLQPWTEDPDAERDALKAKNPRGQKGFLATLATMNGVAAEALRIANQKPRWMSATAQRELAFLGEDNIKNKSAVQNLIDMGKASGAKPRYLRYGDKTGLEKFLPGVKVHVLGPPDLTQSDAIRSQRAKDQDEFWQLRGATFATSAPVASAGGASGKVPAQARWFRDRLQNMSAAGLLEIVRQLDAQMNNTSLILLFEVNGKKLLFPGDAQLENWSYALKEAKDSAKVRKLMAQVDFYKVGHHGSLNATPRKMLWDNFAKKGAGKKLKTMLSTMSNKHGDPHKDTEVPRDTLKSALQNETELQNTQSLTSSKTRVLLTTI
jgi:hypothetical protein